MRLVKLNEVIPTPWRNGQGVTRELCISPSNSSLEQENFLWRASCAEVHGDCQFSNFKKYDRVLLVWRGEGLMLNNKKIEPFMPYYFTGEEKIQCQPIGANVSDFGVIYKRETQHSETQLFNLSKTEELNLHSKSANALFFCAKGEVGAENLALSAGDVAILEGLENIHIKAKTPAIMFCVFL